MAGKFNFTVTIQKINWKNIHNPITDHYAQVRDCQPRQQWSTSPSGHMSVVLVILHWWVWPLARPWTGPRTCLGTGRPWWSVTRTSGGPSPRSGRRWTASQPDCWGWDWFLVTGSVRTNSNILNRLNTKYIYKFIFKSQISTNQIPSYCSFHNNYLSSI